MEKEFTECLKELYRRASPSVENVFLLPEVDPMDYEIEWKEFAEVVNTFTKDMDKEEKSHFQFKIMNYSPTIINRTW